MSGEGLQDHWFPGFAKTCLNLSFIFSSHNYSLKILGSFKF